MQKIKESISWILIISIIYFLLNLVLGYSATIGNSFSQIAYTLQRYLVFSFPWYHKLLPEHDVMTFALAIVTSAALTYLVIWTILWIVKKR